MQSGGRVTGVGADAMMFGLSLGFFYKIEVDCVIEIFEPVSEQMQ